MAEKSKSKGSELADKKARSQVSQNDVPAYTLNEALRVPATIIENYASQPTDTFLVAKAMGLLPNSSQFRMLTAAAVAYGLTEGTAYAEQINVLPLAERIIQSDNLGSAMQAKREALLNTRVIREFLEKYDGSPLPPNKENAFPILEKMGVPRERAEKTYSWILESAESVGFLEEIKNKKYVYLNRITHAQEQTEIKPIAEIDNKDSDLPAPKPDKTLIIDPVGNSFSKTSTDETLRRRVFITHGKNRDFLELIKKLLNFGELEPVISVEKTSVSEPVPDKVMNEMRSCGAAIIHVDAELRLMDSEAKEHVLLNPNVLIEIGAAMALYGRRFILLVKEGVTLPSNLQGLYEVRYSGDALDGETTYKLLEAITQMKNRKAVDTGG